MFASSDLIAAQFLQICHAMSIAVPDDIKVVGFDDSYIASVTTPQITTIHQPIKEMAQKAIECLVDSVEGKIVPTRTTLPVRLVVRGQQIRINFKCTGGRRRRWKIQNMM